MAAMATTVRARGQVTVPKPVRDRLGLVPGSQVAFDVDAAGRVTLRKVVADQGAGDRVARMRGRAAAGLNLGGIMAMTGGED